MADQTDERTTAQATEQQPVVTERDLFRFNDGKRQRAMDPMKIWTAMWMDEEVDIGNLLQRMNNNELEAVNELLPRARTWLKCPEYNDEDDSGLTDLEFCHVLYAWLEYVIEVKKKRGQLPIPLRLLVQPFPGSQSTTKPNSDSSSTPSELPSGEPITA